MSCMLGNCSWLEGPYPDTGEPFCIYSFNNDDTAGVYWGSFLTGNVSISIDILEIVKIPKKYMPKHTHSPEEIKNNHFILTDIETGYAYNIYMQDGNLMSAPQCTGIVVVKPPDKTDYEIGEYLETDGMIIAATYSDGSAKTLRNSWFSYVQADENGYMTLEYIDEFGALHTIRHSSASWKLIDFEYKDNGDGTCTLLAWKETLNGEPSTELIIPDDSNIIL